MATEPPDSNRKEVPEEVSSELLLVLIGAGALFMGRHSPEFRLPGNEWIGSAVQIAFFALGALLLLVAGVLWRKNKKNSSNESTD